MYVTCADQYKSLSISHERSSLTYLFGSSNATVGLGNTDNVFPEASLAVHLYCCLPLSSPTELLLGFPARNVPVCHIQTAAYDDTDYYIQVRC